MVALQLRQVVVVRRSSSPGIGQLAAHNGARPVAGSLFPNMVGQQDPWLCRLEPVTSNVRSLPQLPTPSSSPTNEQL
jgi:hypothetical protein